MANGLQVWNAAGELILDGIDRLCRVHGEYYVPPLSDETYFVTVAGMVNDGTWFLVPKSPAPTGVSFSVGVGGIDLSCPYTLPDSESFTMLVLRG